MKSVAILGCGPAGLMVAHAAALSGWNFRIYSRKQKSLLYGAQYLHSPIPNVPVGDPKMVRYTVRGRPEDYRRKVYGDSWDGTVSPEDFEEHHYAWDIRAAYGWLWAEYNNQIRELDIKWSADGGLRRHLGERVDLVISTVPRTIWSEPGDVFESQRIWALGDAEAPRVHLHRPPENTVLLNGNVLPEWYRVSNIFGYCTMEWPYDEAFGIPLAPARGASIVHKPLRHNSTAASDFIHMGRFGAWRKGYLSHEAFYDAMKTFAADTI